MLLPTPPALLHRSLQTRHIPERWGPASGSQDIKDLTPRPPPPTPTCCPGGRGCELAQPLWETHTPQQWLCVGTRTCTSLYVHQRPQDVPRLERRGTGGPRGVTAWGGQKGASGERAAPVTGKYCPRGRHRGTQPGLWGLTRSCCRARGEPTLKHEGAFKGVGKTEQKDRFS